MAIPKRIHMTCARKAELPAEFLDNIQAIKALNPGWALTVYDNADMDAYVREHGGEAIHFYYTRINPKYGAARADFFRYLLMAKYGGVYLDIKSTVTRPLDEVLRAEDVYLLSHWRNGPGERYAGWGLHPGCGPDGEWQQWHIVAAPGHPFLRAVLHRVMANIDAYRPDVHGVSRPGVFWTTGPIAYTTAIEGIRGAAGYRVVDIEALGFVYSIQENFKAVAGTGYAALGDPVVFGLAPGREA